MKSGEGDIIGALAVVRDITEQRKAEEARRRSDALLRRTEAQTNVGGWEIDFRTGEGVWTGHVYRIHA